MGSKGLDAQLVPGQEGVGLGTGEDPGRRADGADAPAGKGPSKGGQAPAEFGRSLSPFPSPVGRLNGPGNLPPGA